MVTVGALECLDGNTLGLILPSLTGIDETPFMCGLRAANCFHYGCMTVYFVTDTDFECIWGYTTVLEMILNAVFVPLLVSSLVSLSMQENTIEELMWHSGLIHVNDMDGPMELCLENYIFNTCEARFVC